MTTDVPGPPADGVKELTCGPATSTEKFVLFAVPDSVVTVIGPVAAPAGTVAVICVALLTV